MLTKMKIDIVQRKKRYKVQKWLQLVLVYFPCSIFTIMNSNLAIIIKKHTLNRHSSHNRTNGGSLFKVFKELI